MADKQRRTESRGACVNTTVTRGVCDRPCALRDRGGHTIVPVVIEFRWIQLFKSVTFIRICNMAISTGNAAPPMASTLELTKIARLASQVPLLPRQTESFWGCGASHGAAGGNRQVCPLDGTPNSTVMSSMFGGAWTDGWLYSTFFCDRCSAPRQYLEMGALDGVAGSNSMLFEKHLNFQGVLVEGLPANAARLWANRGRHSRNVIFAEAVCLETGKVQYFGAAGKGTAGLLEEMDPDYLRFFHHRFKENRTVPCQPLRNMLEIAGITKIDFFSLDVEGAELMVLQTMAWHIPVRVFLVETGGPATKNDAMRRLLARHGYAPCVPDGRGNLTAAELARGDGRVGGFGESHQHQARAHFNELFVHRDLLEDIPRRLSECGQCQRLPYRGLHPGGRRRLSVLR